MKNLENYGVVEMDAKEMKQIQGGGFFGALLGFLVGAVASLFISEAKVSKDGVSTQVGGDSKMMVCGIIGATFGAMLPF